MKTHLLFLLIFPIIFTSHLSSQSVSDVPVFEGRLLFSPLIAHHVEPRMGFVRLIGEERLRLDIGNSVDLYRWDSYSDDVFAVGADFFTWTSLRQEADFHFPVDAVDYLFGVNASYQRKLDENTRLSGRLRLSHISAHLVDGSYDKERAAWRDDQLPRVYSREYVEIIAAVELYDALRMYAGGQYIYHIDPADLGKWAVQFGGEATWSGLLGSRVHPYVAIDVRLLDIHGWSAAVNAQVGVKAGTWRGTGINLFIARFDGRSQHGEYYDQDWSYWGPGMTIDF